MRHYIVRWFHSKQRDAGASLLLTADAVAGPDPLDVPLYLINVGLNNEHELLAFDIHVLLTERNQRNRFRNLDEFKILRRFV